MNRALSRVSIMMVFMTGSFCASFCACRPRSDDVPQGPVSVSATVAAPVEMPPVVSCFSADNAWTHIEKIVAFGERHAGTPGLEQTRRYIEEELRRAGLTPVRHPFIAHTPHPEIGSVACANISADITGSDPAAKTVILSGHFDGKIIEEGLFQGANDGGSSTGVLLEIGRCLRIHPPLFNVRLVFFDAEEALVKWSDADSLYGSKNYAASLVASKERDNIAALVNIDMVGDPNLRFEDELNSTPWVMNALRSAGRSLGREELFAGRSVRIEDDHLPFIQVGIPAANLIDLMYGPGWDSNAWWHTPNDNLNNLSRESLEISGRIVLHALPALIKEEPK